MNSKPLVFLLTLALALSAQTSYAFVYSTGNATIPDNDGNGYYNSQNVSGLSGVISDVNVSLTVSNGFNGDLYAWISHGTGVAVLLNRVGVSSSNAVGYADAGFGLDGQQNRFTLDDQAAQDVHFYHDVDSSLNPVRQLTGIWQPDGRSIDPGSSAGSFDTAPRSNMLSAFNSMDPNGQWTL